MKIDLDIILNFQENKIYVTNKDNVNYTSDIFIYGDNILLYHIPNDIIPFYPHNTR